MMNDKQSHDVRVEVDSIYIPEQSDPNNELYVFAYTVNIYNNGEVPAKLLTRHWVITDSHGHIQEVKGEGVIGQHPHLEPGESFSYSSGTHLETAIGVMEGSYQMRADDGTLFDAQIPAFTLAVPNTLH